MNHGDTEGTEKEAAELSALFRSLADCLRARNAKPKPGVSEKEIAEFEQRYGRQLPSLLREYFSALDGTGLDYSEDDFIAFWSIDEFAPLYLNSHAAEAADLLDDSESWFIIADHSIGLNYYAVNLNDLRIVTCAPETHYTRWFRSHVDPACIYKEFASFDIFIIAYIRYGLAGIT